jgi:hypothetical protein
MEYPITVPYLFCSFTIIKFAKFHTVKIVLNENT